ncbi:hypothetical protein ACQ86N_02375 [Puia sp. P3]|uniref:hypothetical protein n=1 Tax=Puia sp. P3 TaxID=3423952 RepID=UPI003D679B1C
MANIKQVQLIMEETTKKGKWLNKNIFGMGLASFFSDMNHEMASAVLPLFLSSVLGAPAFALGLIEGVADGVSTLFEIWSGWYSDKIGKRKGLATIGYFITAFSKASFRPGYQLGAGTHWQNSRMDRLVHPLARPGCLADRIHDQGHHR